ncbi:universal stress protein [Nocardioides aurantiacus]|uniref:universal stress protein n=1 Tax=Nocardioides aurantiacus TaxID=86796 RepID=UPI00403F5122
MTDAAITSTTPAEILVGVDGSAGSAAAVRYAAHAAEAREIGVHLLYVIPLNMAMSPMFPMIPEEMEPVGRRLIKEAEAIVADVLATGRVTSSLHHGQRASSLVEASEGAPFIVLGRAEKSTAERLLTWSVVTAVSARSTGSVVVVPAGWAPREGQFHVVVGIKDIDHSGELALRAMRVAADRGGRVTFVHAWDMPSFYDDLTSTGDSGRDWAQRNRDVMFAKLSGVTALYSEVPVDIRVVRGQPARALQQESGSADLLLLARRGHVFPHAHLGGTARALLRESSCPVEVVPPADQPDGADLVLAGAGTASFVAQ